MLRAIFIALTCGLVAAASARAAEISISSSAVGVERELCRDGARRWARESGNSVRLISTPNSAGERLALYQQLLALGLVARPLAWTAEPGLAMASVIMVDVWKTTAFVALLALAGLQLVPRECREAARIDGAGPVREFLSVTLTIIRPALMVAVVFRALDALRVFDIVYVLTSNSIDTRQTDHRALWILTTFMRELPRELEEAALIDGAGAWQTLALVLAPLVAPAMASAGLLAFIAAWNEFLFALTFTLTDAERTVPVAIALMSGASQYELPWGNLMAASVIVTLPLVALMLAFQRRIVAGLTAGAVKG
ncbi:MAG TPA: ABC transporter permease subunit [Burkholderiales bacterium]|nr:ABC transporter permease subunit [Burkholderiales bacterium]